MPDKLIVVGASAGGLSALRAFCAALPHDLAAPVLVVQHISPTARSTLPELLSRSGPLQAMHGGDGVELQAGHIYIAPPDLHMLVDGRGRLLLRRGPQENRTRPAIDPLFRSAALASGPGCIGIVMSGLLDDGTAGLVAIKQCGGTTMVQDPTEASWPDMPRNALAGDHVDHCLGAADLAALLPELLRRPTGPRPTPPAHLVSECRISQQEMPDMSEFAPTVGTPSALSCPNCGGVLNELHNEKVPRFRCQIGHAYSSRTLEAAQVDVLEEALSVALRTHRERLTLFRRMHDNAVKRGHPHAAERWQRAVSEAEQATSVINAAIGKLKVSDDSLQD